MASVIFEFAAKPICGLQREHDDLRLSTGRYQTENNLHNPQRPPGQDHLEAVRAVLPTRHAAAQRRAVASRDHGLSPHGQQLAADRALSVRA